MRNGKQRTSLRASRHSRGTQGQLQYGRSADHRRLRPARRLDSSRRRVRREEAARRGGSHPGKDEHVRVCLAAFAKLARRAVAESPRSQANAGRFVGRHRRRHRGGVRAARDGDRYRRFDPRAIDGERHRGFETDPWSSQQKRHHSAFADIRHRRADGPQMFTIWQLRWES